MRTVVPLNDKWIGATGCTPDEIVAWLTENLDADSWDFIFCYEPELCLVSAEFDNPDDATAFLLRFNRAVISNDEQ